MGWKAGQGVPWQRQRDVVVVGEGRDSATWLTTTGDILGRGTKPPLGCVQGDEAGQEIVYQPERQPDVAHVDLPRGVTVTAARPPSPIVAGPGAPLTRLF